MQWLRGANTLHGGAQRACPGSDAKVQPHQVQVDFRFLALLNGGHEQGDAGSVFLFSCSRFQALVAQHYMFSITVVIHDQEIRQHVSWGEGWYW